MMTVHQHAGLRCAPFEASADVDCYCPTPTHAEARATLEYAVATGQACTLLIGSSGLGKTLLGRLIERSGLAQDQRRPVEGGAGAGGRGEPATGAQTLLVAGRAWPPVRDAAKRLILWVEGCQAGERLTAVQRGAAAPLTIAPLDDWRVHIEAAAADDAAAASNAAASRACNPVLIVDDADELDAGGWRRVLEFAAPLADGRRPALLLLGGPRLRALLDQPLFDRLQRRIFRTAVLTPLSASEIRSYVRYRVARAGAKIEELFEEAALAVLERLSGGNPARINRLCENALLEAFAGEERQVTHSHLLAAASAITGRGPAFDAQAGAAVSANTVPAAARTPSGPEQGAPNAAAATKMPQAAPAAARPRVRARPPLQPATTIQQRLSGMERRLSDALAGLRAGRETAMAPVASKSAAPSPARAAASPPAPPRAPSVVSPPEPVRAEPRVTPVVWKRIGTPPLGRRGDREGGIV